METGMYDEKDKRKRIVCVDDVQLMLLTLKEKLKKYYNVYPARSAEELYEMLENDIEPDLMILDIGIPEVDGYDIIKKLKADPKFCDIPIMFLTGKNDKRSVIQALNLGAVDVLFKPISDAQLIERIEYHCDPKSQVKIPPVVLAVDDSPSILQEINYALSDYTVYTLPKPEAIGEILKKVTPDLFILDCKMPVMSGFELIDLIRKDPLHEDTPIVFLTSEGDQDTIYAAVGMGVCDYIVKPIDPNVLKDKVALHLRNFEKIRVIRSIPK